MHGGNKRSYILRGYLRYKTIASQNMPPEAQVKIFFVSSFFIFDHPMIYQISDVMMSAFLNISFEPQLINPPNLVN